MPTKKQLDNLKNGKATRFRSGEEAARNGKKGGQASGEARRRLKSFRELDADFTTDDERKEMLDALKLKAKRGNMKAFEIYRDTVGLKPKENVEISGELANPFAGLTDAELKKLAGMDG